MSEQKGRVRQLILGGILPIAAYTVAEEVFGIFWGLVAGMVIGMIEMTVEWVRDKKVSGLTLGATVLIVGLGGISLATQDGIWFKLQPAIMEAVMTVVLVASSIMGKPLLVMLSEKQGMFGQMHPMVEGVMREKFAGLNWRMAIFFGLHAVLATWAALYWSTRAWALLKGVGFTGSMVVYMGIEVLLIRRALTRMFQESAKKSG